MALVNAVLFIPTWYYELEEIGQIFSRPSENYKELDNAHYHLTISEKSSSEDQELSSSS